MKLMPSELPLYAAEFVLGVVFALVIELSGWRKVYEPGYTWIPATIGIALVGLIVAGRLAWFPLPPLANVYVAVWWLWWVIFWSFMASAVPIWIWQAIIQTGRLKEALAFMERWR